MYVYCRWIVLGIVWTDWYTLTIQYYMRTPHDNGFLASLCVLLFNIVIGQLLSYDKLAILAQS